MPELTDIGVGVAVGVVLEVGRRIHGRRAAAYDLYRETAEREEQLTRQLAEVSAATPRPVLNLYIEADRVFLDVFNEGAAGVFHLQIARVEGVPDWPTKSVSGRWDHDYRTHVASIAKGATFRFRIADKLDKGWRLSFVTDVKAQEKVAPAQAVMTVALLAHPDLDDGPLRRTLLLNEDGTVAMLGG